MKKADLSRFLGWFLLYLPFGVALSPFSDVDLSSVRVIILALFTVWVAASLANGHLRFPSSLSGLMIASFLFLSAFSLFFAQNQGWSLRKLAFLFSIFPIYWVLSDRLRWRSSARRVLRMAVLGAFGVALIGIIQFGSQFVFGIDPVYGFWAKHIAPAFLGKAFSKAVLENPSWLVNVSGRNFLRAVSVFPDPHMFSFYLGLAIPVSFGLGIESRKRFWLIVSGALILADVLTFSRGGYLGLLGASLALAGLFWRRMANRAKLALIFLAMAIIMLLVVPSPIADRFFSSFDLREGSNAGRLAIWKQASEVIINHPVFGVGLGNYPLEIKPTADYREPIYAHSAYLDIAAETGSLNAAIWLTLVASLIFSFMRESKRDGMFLWLAISVIIFAVHSLVETPLYSPAVMTLFLAIASLDNSNEREESYEKPF